MSSIANNLAEQFGTKGSPISLSTACASGASAIQLGVEAIRRGKSDAALCIGTDGSVDPELLIRFSLLSALSTRTIRPRARQGRSPRTAMASSWPRARRRGAGKPAIRQGTRRKILGVLEGCGEMADSFHRTRSSPDGKPIIGCIRNALADAGLAPEDIDYINPHGTGTPENDKMECLGVIVGVRRAQPRRMPISSNKSMIGHTLSAAGTVEAVFTLMTLQNQRIPPTINYQVPDPAIPLDVVPNQARDANVRHAISNSFGFGGQNVCAGDGARTGWRTATIRALQLVGDRKLELAEVPAPPPPARARSRSRSRRWRSIISTSGASAAWRLPSAGCR